MKAARVVAVISLAFIAMAPAGVRGDSWQSSAPPISDSRSSSDDEDQPTWRELLAPQAADLVLFPAFVGLAIVGFVRKSARLKHVTLAASVLYLGVLRSQMFSVTNIFSLLSWNLPLFRYSVFWYLFAGFTIVSTILWGRLYCGRICAYGALTQLLDLIVPARLRYEVPRQFEQYAAKIKYGILALVVLYFLVTRDISVYRYVEPFWMFTGHGTAVMWIALATLLVATVFVRNLYCRFLCPVGGFLGLLSGLTIFGIKRWSECQSCKICEKACEWGAIRGPTIIESECVRCDDCERLYMDTRKCPHWIIILRREDKAVAAARRSATSALSADS